MRNTIRNSKQTIKNVLLVACAAMCGAAFTAAPSQAAEPARLTPPPVPAEIEVPAGFEPFLVGHGVGTQNYVCVPSGSGFAFTLFTPQATLFTDQGHQVTTHFFSPNPDEGGVIRVAWEHSRDTSTVWGQVTRQFSDPPFVIRGAIPWLRVDVVGAAEGPTGGRKLTDTKFIQRVNTVGGAAPAIGCRSAADVGNKEFVPYTADYFFFRKHTEEQN